MSHAERHLIGNPMFVAGYAWGRISGPPRRAGSR